MSTPQFRMSNDEISEIVDKNTQQSSCVIWIVLCVLLGLAFLITLGFLIYKLIRCKPIKTIIPPITRLTTT
jgi:hypothetical protein